MQNPSFSETHFLAAESVSLGGVCEALNGAVKVHTHLANTKFIIYDTKFIISDT